MKKVKKLNVNWCSVIYQPHFNTNCFRVATKNNMATNSGTNWVVITCSKEYNGVYTYPAKNIQEKGYSIWKNGKLNCWCVPIEDCTKICSLERVKELANSEDCREFDALLFHEIQAQQKKWLKNEVKNRDYEYAKKPEWMI